MLPLISAGFAKDHTGAFTMAHQGDTTNGIPNSIVRRRPRPPTAPATSTLQRQQRPEAVIIRTGAVDARLKRTSSDSNLVQGPTAEQKERFAKWAAIRRQPEYRRLMHNMKVKEAFAEEGDGKENDRDSSFASSASSSSRLHIRRGSTGSVGPLPAFPGHHRLGKHVRKGGSAPTQLTGILRKNKVPATPPPSPTLTVASSNNDSQSRRQVRFKDDDVASSGGRSSRQASTDSLSSRGSGHRAYNNRKLIEKDFPAKNGKRRDGLNTNVSMAASLGVGQISMQMSDFYRPGHSKTMSVNYSSSVLNQNSRILSEDLIKLSGKKTEARSAFVRRTERRLRILQKNRELRTQTKAESDRRKRQQEGDDADMESAYFRRPEETILSRPSAEMQELLTSAEKKEMRQERIRERTMLLPENYRTANYIKDYSEEQAKTVGGAGYLRSAGEEGEMADNEMVEVFEL